MCDDLMFRSMQISLDDGDEWWDLPESDASAR